MPLPAATSSTFEPDAEVERFAELLADDLQRGADDGVIARRPCGLLSRLEGGKIRGCRGSGRSGWASLRSLCWPSVSPFGIGAATGCDRDEPNMGFGATKDSDRGLILP